MRFGLKLAMVPALLCATALPSFAGPRIHRGPTSPKLFKSRAKHPKEAAATGIAPERATQIQTALIQSGYLSGTPSGQWDAETQAAMAKLQADNGWQTKLVPDARAIIKLGLGPSSDNGALNAVVEPSESTSPAAPVAGELSSGTSK